MRCSGLAANRHQHHQRSRCDAAEQPGTIPCRVLHDSPPLIPNRTERWRSIAQGNRRVGFSFHAPGRIRPISERTAVSSRAPGLKERDSRLRNIQPRPKSKFVAPFQRQVLPAARGHAAHVRRCRQMSIKKAEHRLPGFESLRKLLANCLSAPTGSIRPGRNLPFLAQIPISCSKRASFSCADRWSDP